MRITYTETSTTYAKTSTETLTRTSTSTTVTTTVTRTATTGTTTTSYRSTVTRTVTATSVSTVTSLVTTTTTSAAASTTTTRTVTGASVSTTTLTEYAVEADYETTTTTTTSTFTWVPIKYSKWFEVLIEDNRGVIVEGMTYNHVDFQISDWTRGPGSGVPPKDLPSGFTYARQITVENHLTQDTLKSGYTVGFSLDTSSLVSSGKMRSDLGDLRVFHYKNGNWFDLDRDVLRLDTDLVEVRFQTQADIGAGGFDGNYFLCYGNPAANAPPRNLDNVYIFHDDFEAGNLNRWTIINGAWKINSTQARSGTRSLAYPSEGGGDAIIVANPALNERDVYLEAWWRFNTTDVDISQIFRLRPGGDSNYETNLEGLTGWDIAKRIDGDWTELASNTVTPTADAWTRIAISIYGTGMRVFKEGVQINPPGGSYDVGNELDRGNVGFRKWLVGSGTAWWIDDVTVREYVEPEPTILMGFEVYPSGGRFSSNDTYETYNLEVMYNASTGTAWYWNGEQLEISGGYPPVPPVPIRQLRVNATTLGVGRNLTETPSQVEQWSSDMRRPLYVMTTGNTSARFNDRSKLTFNVGFPWNVTTQQVTVWWMDDLEVAPPSYGINMTVAGPFVIVDNGRYRLQLLAEQGYSTWIDWSISLQFANYHAEYALFGYDVYEIPPPGSGRYWFPMKIPAGSWDSPVVYGPVRAIVHRRSNVVYDYPNDIQINDELDHEMYIVIPYDVKYFFWKANNTWLKAVSPRSLDFISMISGDALDVGNPALRVRKYAYQVPQGLVRTGSFADYSVGEHQGQGFGYWSAQYRNGFGEAMLVNNRFLELIKNETWHPRSDLFVFTSYDYARRVVVYDAEDTGYGSYVTIEAGRNYALSVAMWAYEGGWEEARQYHSMFVEEHYPTIFAMPD